MGGTSGAALIFIKKERKKIMNEKELFQKVYDVLFEHGRDFVEISRKTDSKVSELIEGNIFEVTPDEEEAISGCIIDILNEARQDSFVLGIKYTVKALCHLLSN